MTNRDLLDTALCAARRASDILRSGFGGNIAASTKEGRHNLVTEFDVRCEQAIIEELRRATPNASILAEESGASGTHADLQWVIDPLDGTVNFAHGLPIFSVSVAAVHNGSPVCGVVIQPMLGEEFTAVVGEGAFLNGRQLRVSDTAPLGQAFLVTGFPYNVHTNPKSCVDQFVRLVSSGIPIRRLGSAALDLAYLAAGRFDGYWEVHLNAWDMAAGVLLVTEAGGTVSHYGGERFVLGHSSIVATNGKIHDELVHVLAEATA